MDRKELGERGERASAAFLEKRGMRIVEKNWHCSYGEVDLIAMDGDTLVFCEVKTRRTTSAGIPEEAITPAKQRRYLKLARVYCSRTHEEYENVRFDAVAIYAFSDSQALLRYVCNAFDASDE